MLGMEASTLMNILHLQYIFLNIDHLKTFYCYNKLERLDLIIILKNLVLLHLFCHKTLYKATLALM